jgi:hypothetical protein
MVPIALGSLVVIGVAGVAAGTIIVYNIATDYCKSAWLHAKAAYYSMRAKVSSWF